MSTSPVRLWRESVALPTYEPFAPNRNPMFLEKRVYQGSSGRVYPLPVIDRIATAPTVRTWDAVYLENEYIRVMVLPQIGGRIHAAQDRTNGYDFIYRQDVIKPALVGLAGPWLSGGIEFNWPQHHRPSTFMPCDTHVEEHPDGSRTLWLSEHDPLQRMKGMHGVCLHPGRAVIELKVRAYNRTPFVQTFLWWANLAARVHEAYRSFFPPDVTYVADHAKRSMSAYPLARGRYYGVDYAARARHGVPADEIPPRYVPPHCQPLPAEAGASAAGVPPYTPNDLSWYANIPVPTSYMAMGTREDFFGGYDYRRRAGLIHVANHHLSPGKKQWTWGNQEFGYAWDRNLTDPDAGGEHAPYIELMAGVYTDNQPDFSFLAPGETKTWSQFWYPYREIGPVQHANVEAAIAIESGNRGRRAAWRLGLAVTRAHEAAQLQVTARGRVVLDRTVALAPDRPHVADVLLPRGTGDDVVITLRAEDGSELLRYQPVPPREGKVPSPATEPPPPAEIASVDELFITGVHLDQYRHATRRADLYWREALRRDPGDSRCNHALGAWHLRRGEFREAEARLRRAIERLTLRNPNPYDGEVYYTLGLCLRYLGRDDEAYDAFYKATWNQAWQPAAFHALAEIDCTRGAWALALDHLDRALRVNADNLRARNLRAVVLRKLGLTEAADEQIRATIALDPLDWWARHLAGEPLRCDTQTRLDLAHDFARAGQWRDALGLIAAATPEPRSGTASLVGYTAAWLAHRLGDRQAERRWLRRARAASPDYCFPARLEELVILEWAAGRDPKDPRAAFFLGNLLYDRRRHAEAIACWERAARLDPTQAVVWRNLGLGYYNVRHEPAKARRAYERAFAAEPRDARLFYERDQLWKRIGVGIGERLREFETHAELVAQRDDLTCEHGALLLQAGRAAEALALMLFRKFQPWEGGEGTALGIFVRARVALGRTALAAGDAAVARRHFEQALAPPLNLGEARHLLANVGDVHYWLGCALAAAGERKAARSAWKRAGELKGDFQEKHVSAYSEKTYFTALAWAKLGRAGPAKRLLRALLAHARGRPDQPAKIDYFATSLPAMILFEEDLEARRAAHARFLEGIALLGLGRRSAGRQALREVLRRDPSHAAAQAHLE